MRIPTIILLSSVALSLLVSAENTPTTNAVVAAPIAANIAADLAIDKPADTKEDPKSDIKPAAEENAKAEPGTSLKMKEDDKLYPVGNGIVFTKTTFSVDNKDDKTKNTEEGSDKFSATGFMDGLLDTLLGIDINLGGGGSKKKKDPPADSPSTPPVEETDPDYIPLYGDDGYKPRPVPKGCNDLSFLDQMIWDQQGNRGQVEGPEATTPALPANAIAPPVAVEADKKADAEPTDVTDKKDTTDKKDATGKKDSADKKDTTDKKDAAEKKDTHEPEDAANKKIDSEADDDKSQKVLAHIDSSAITVTDKKDNISPKDSKDISAENVSPSLISICIPGPCHEDDDDDDEKGHRKRIRHKQKKFLKQFLGKALKIDGRTGCPIPSRN
ncbi:hypothetical protein EC991_006126 [Linnemannia zychae]|nr:hypothetical protein EC991_006126 [Linnemannia zychae]